MMKVEDNIEIQELNIIEFELDQNTYIEYNVKSKEWSYSFIYLEEEGEEYEGELDINSLPWIINGCKVTKEDFENFTNIIEENEEGEKL